MHNPLKRPILEILKNTDGVLKEYQLHRLLGGEAFSQFVEGCSDELALFRKHFLVMNALYELHEELLEQKLYLQISALEIKLYPVAETPSWLQPGKTLEVEHTFAKLSQYYRDWQYFNKTNDADVEALLKGFWNTYLVCEEKTEALACLRLDNNAKWPEIQQQYRHLCQQHHPDKGGDPIYFIEIRQAFDNLKSVYKNAPNQSGSV